MKSSLRALPVSARYACILSTSILSAAILSACATSIATVAGESDPAEWQYHGSDAASTKFSPLTEIDASNFDDLRIIWRWQAPDSDVAGPGLAEEEHSRSTPIVVDGVIYFSTPLNIVAAIDATTGEELWTFDPGAWQHEDFLFGFHRGVSYWQSPEGEERILFGTFMGYFYSIDAKTGLLDPAFGDQGRIDLTTGLGREVDRFSYSFLSPPIISHDIAVVGSTIIDWWAGRPLPALPPPGDVRGIDVRTGETVWTFHTVPHEGEFGAETWHDGAWQTYGAANVWSMMSADDDLGYVYLPTGTISSDYYGGGRPGDNLFGDGLLCLDVRTGERIWHYQFIHHGLFDYDTPAAPVLVDVLHEGRLVKAVAQVTKQGFCYVFDRVTGEPLWPIEERPAPASTAAAEHASPTQPFPTKPAAFDRQGLALDDLIDFTPQLRKQAEEIVSGHLYGPLYTPPSEAGTIFLPGINGAANWPGAAADPTTGILYVPSNTNTSLITLKLAAEGEAPYEKIGRVRPFFGGPQDLPLVKPPYSRITAIDLNTGEHAWMRVTGAGPVNHPLLRDLDLDDIGWPFRAQFVTLTPNLLLSVSPRPWGGDYFIDPRSYIIARDPETGDELGRAVLPSEGANNAITFRAGHRQQIVVPMRNAELIALAIPREGEQLPQQVIDRTDADHPQFYAAVAALDGGDVTRLQGLIDANPTLLAARGYLDEAFEHPAFRGATLLHHVAGDPIRTQLPANTLQITRLLLDAGADVRATTLEGTGIFSLVAGARQPRWNGIKDELIQLLAKAGADLDGEGGKTLYNALSRPDNRAFGVTLFEMGASLDLRFAAGLGFIDEMEGFFRQDGTLTDDAISTYRPLREGEIGFADAIAEALSFAAFNGRLEAVDYLLAWGADPDRLTPGFLWPGDRGANALHRAIRGDQPHIVRRLLAAGADVTIHDLNWDSAPGQWAGYFAGKEIIDLLTETE